MEKKIWIDENGKKHIASEEEVLSIARSVMATQRNKYRWAKKTDEEKKAWSDAIRKGKESNK
jgi:hypothetical protein